MDVHGLVTSEIEEGFLEILVRQVVTGKQEVGNSTLEISGRAKGGESMRSRRCKNVSETHATAR
jgi:hypothetical protein